MKRRGSNRNKNLASVCFGSALVAIAAAQRTIRGEPQIEDSQVSDNEKRREKMRELREELLKSSREILWNGVEESGLDLPRFIVHEGNRRHLNSDHSLPVPFSDDENSSLYAIGSLDSQGRDHASSQAQGNPRPRPSSKSSKSSGSGKGKGVSSKGGKGKGGSSAKPPNSQPPPGCTLQLDVDFLQLSAIPPAVFVNPNDPDEQTLGTRYIFNDGLRDQDSLDELVGSNASGSCTRTQARIGDVDIGLQLGRGHCQFTYTIKDARNREIIFSVSGDVTDSLGGVLSITGGSNNALGAFGEIELLPVNLGGNGQFVPEPGDFFLDPIFYLADARIYIPCT